MNMNSTLVFALVLTVVVPAAAQDHKRHAGPGPHARAPRAVTERAFVSEALSAGRLEVLLAQHVIGKTLDYDVKKYAMRISEDHVRRNAELEALAEAAGIEVEPVIRPEHRLPHDRLWMLALGEMDDAYREQAVAANARLMGLYTQRASRGPASGLKVFARRHLDEQQAHLRLARRLEDRAPFEAHATAIAPRAY